MPDGIDIHDIIAWYLSSLKFDRFSVKLTIPTGGQGSGPGVRFAGDALGSARSVELSDNRRWLYVTNAGSDTISLFRVRRNGLELSDVVPTGDGSPSERFPNSVAQHGKLVYVLNAAGNGSITGFKRRGGRLVPIEGSTRFLDANQERFPPDALFNPTQVSFTPDGNQLVITIKDGPAAGSPAPFEGIIPTGPGRVLVFNIDNRGVPSKNFVQTDFDNRGPFGFSFDGNGNLLVSLFIGGENFTSAVGSYRINSNGSLAPITPLVQVGEELDLCWLENNGRFAYGSNFGTGVISSFTIGSDGSLALLDAQAGLTQPTANSQGSTPIDLGISREGDFLYAVLPGSGAVAAWSINSDGSLTSIGEFADNLDATIDGDQAEFDFSPGASPAGIAVF